MRQPKQKYQNSQNSNQVNSQQDNFNKRALANLNQKHEDVTKDETLDNENKGIHQEDLNLSRGFVQMMMEADFSKNNDARQPHFPANTNLITKNKDGSVTKKRLSMSKPFPTPKSNQELKIDAVGSKSGVTIGFGIDLGTRYSGSNGSDKAKKDFINAGISEKDAEELAKVAGLTGLEAAKMCNKIKPKISLTAKQCFSLLKVALPDYEKKTYSNSKYNYKKGDGKIHPALEEFISYAAYWGNVKLWKTLVEAGQSSDNHLEQFETAKKNLTQIINTYIEEDDWKARPCLKLLDTVDTLVDVIRSEGEINISDEVKSLEMLEKENTTLDFIKDMKEKSSGYKDMGNYKSSIKKEQKDVDDIDYVKSIKKLNAGYKTKAKRLDHQADKTSRKDIIDKSVGEGAPNLPKDVKVIQQLLYNSGKYFEKLEDINIGVYDAKTEQALHAFMLAERGQTYTTIDPNQGSIRVLKKYRYQYKPMEQRAKQKVTEIARPKLQGVELPTIPNTITIYTKDGEKTLQIANKSVEAEPVAKSTTPSESSTSDTITIFTAEGEKQMKIGKEKSRGADMLNASKPPSKKGAQGSEENIVKTLATESVNKTIAETTPETANINEKVIKKIVKEVENTTTTTEEGISASVGDVTSKAGNRVKDVLWVQNKLLEFKILSEADYNAEKASGEKNISSASIPKTRAAIKAYQTKVLHYSKQDQVVGNDGTMEKSLISMTPELAAQKIKEYPAIEARRKKQAAATKAKKEAENEAKAKEVKTAADKKKAEEQIEAIKAQKTDEASLEQFIDKSEVLGTFINSTDYEDLGKRLVKYTVHNPDFVEKIIKKASGLVNQNTDDIAYHLTKNCTDAQLKSTKQSLKDYLYECMDWGVTDKSDEKQMGRLKLNSKSEEKILKESPKTKEAKVSSKSTTKETKLKSLVISGSVGRKGDNKPEDVIEVQNTLVGLGYLTSDNKETIDESLDKILDKDIKETIKAIEHLHKYGRGLGKDGKISSGKGTNKWINKRLTLIEEYSDYEIDKTKGIDPVLEDSEWISQFRNGKNYKHKDKIYSESDIEKTIETIDTDFEVKKVKLTSGKEITVQNTGQGLREIIEKKTKTFSVTQGIKESQKAYKNKGNFICCWDTAQAMVKQKGGTIFNAPADRLPTMAQYNREKNPVTLKKQTELGVKYIDNQLKNGKPIFIGVDKKKIVSKYNSDHTTEHYIVIIGKVIKNNKVYYRYFDPGNLNVSEGASSNNLLLLGDDFSVKSKNYSVAQVRQNN
ncbi:hypothetical protein [Aureibacter tunicatorum]|uniref:Uncharacterized protein n=1 Tax=Aureibacter tunicatorum TaxID=866807 RepID=A0AAE4BRQ0_9BACT|nr:hypothetical protein [Aureibacter tunicatorum]MDR6237447.1 hypothetical protein [Aureibacter tunicatorum]BDD06437.1 hypothetical protein AUTU_39200 [Aureibacter tunicatorum]